MKFKLFLEALEGMRAKSVDDPKVFYSPGVHRPWVDIMRKLAGQWVDIDTQHIFGDQFNAIDPETGETFNLNIKHVQDIENDVRLQMAKCGYCGATFRDVPDEQLYEPCPKCDKWPIVDSAIIDRLSPLKTIKNGKVVTLNRPKKLKTPEGDVWR